MLRLIPLFMLLAALVLPSAAQSGDSELRTEDFMLSFVPNVQFAPMYVADAKGYFADAGYEFNFAYVDENLGVEQIAAGTASFGAISGEQVLLARQGLRPVVYVYQWFAEYPVGVVITDTVAATSVTELAGLRVGVPGRFGASYTGITALLAANGMSEADIQLEAIGFNAPEVLCAGNVDAAVIYLNNEPLQIEARIESGDCGGATGVTVIPVADAAPMISNGIVTSERMIAEEPEAIAAVVAAFDAALRDVINNPAETYLINLDYVENLPVTDAMRSDLEAAAAAQAEFLATDPDREAIAASRAALYEALAASHDAQTLAQFRVLLATIDLWDTDPLGVSHADNWRVTADALNALGATITEAQIDAAYNNDFVPQSGDDL
jgi:NitT/TauT family transport system substrate-binding protein